MKTLLLIVSFILLLALTLSPIWHRKNNAYNLGKTHTEQLTLLGDSAIQTLDVPVAALIIYNNEIIGKGYNTVKRNNNIGGHAEINAISDAMARLGGIDVFNSLDRDKLYLITTFEPCKMCEGAIIENHIKHVAVVKMKPLKHWFQKMKMQYIYQWNKQQTDMESLQDYLFEKHPDYEKEKAKSGL